MIRDGRPCTCETGKLEFIGIPPRVDDELISDLPEDLRDKAVHWVSLFVTPRKTINKKFSSYSIKHWIERYIGYYITNNQAKDVMLQCGYEPVNPNTKNWHYKINISENGQIK